MGLMIFLSLRRKNTNSGYMPVFSYRTIQSPTGGIYKEKGSKFIASALPVENEKEVKEHLEAIKKEYFDARHHCYAYVLGAAREKFRAFDDGEPNHSAGDPILGQIRSKEITNVLVVVIRYFGGVKLGVGGLISAYKAAAEDALNKATIIEKEVLKDLTLTYDYVATPEVMRLIKDFELTIKEQLFENNCILEVQYKLKFENELLEKIRLLTVTGHKIEWKQ
jgi:uncharacterized YigZ family protein